MEVRPGYKQTVVGVIPEDWDAKTVGGEIDLLMGHPFPSVGYAESGVRLLRGSNVKRGQTDWDDDITQYWPSITPDIARYQLRQGDLVIAMDGSLVGRSFAQLKADDLPALLLQRVARIRSDRLDIKYLTAFVGSDRFVKYADAVKTVTAIPHISPGDIRNFTIPVPPTVEEQRAIAAALSDVDTLLGGLDRLIAKKRNLKQAAMQQLLTGQTRLPGFHGEWEVKTIEDTADCLDNLRVPLNEAQRAQMKGDYPYCGANGVLDYVNGHVIDDDIILIAEDGGYFDEYGTRPIAYRMKGKCWVNNHAHILKSKPGSDQGFLYYSLVHKNILPFLASGTRAKLNKSEMNKIEMLLPNNEAEQTAIAAILSDMDAELSALEARRDKTRALKQGMMQELLTGRTRLVPPGEGGPRGL